MRVPSGEIAVSQRPADSATVSVTSRLAGSMMKTSPSRSAATISPVAGFTESEAEGNMPSRLCESVRVKVAVSIEKSAPASSST
jgi:hypothetical protein